MSRVALVIISGILLLYPVLVFFGLQHLQPRYIGLILVVALLSRLLLVKVKMNIAALRSLMPATVAGGVCCLLILLSNDPLMVRANPIIVNVAMLLLFTFSLFKPPSMIERFARLTQPDLPTQGVIYTRQVTKVWCWFFLFNGIAASYTTFFCSLEVWTWYNGLIAYLIMALIFGIEYLARQRVMRANT
ncbi:hypothetical protein [Oceanicoccus sp. KOV_DT_Chl]|uniref:COG4648 family protein n=1 Tax=Oceanicoccus sp. KOV_DT_Chl TaxID=1904639 RepID=UPI000C7C8919|nr:hypothetical protein [Oceanicoccus sp. KOV_DT_Chl]